MVRTRSKIKQGEGKNDGVTLEHRLHVAREVDLQCLESDNSR